MTSHHGLIGNLNTMLMSLLKHIQDKLNLFMMKMDNYILRK